MTTSNSVGILCISSVICLTCYAETARSFKTYFPEESDSKNISKNKNISVVRILNNNGSRERTIFLPNFVERKNLSWFTISNNDVDVIINDSFNKSFLSLKFKQGTPEQTGNQQNKIINKLIKFRRNSKHFKTIKQMFKFCYINCLKNSNYQRSNESATGIIIFKPRLKIKQALIRKGNNISRKAWVNIGCWLPCHGDVSFKENIRGNIDTIQMTNRNISNNHTIEGKLSKFLNLFTLINFENAPCVAKGGVGGVCYHPSQCQGHGGKIDGSCAEGYGVCCYIEQSCGDRTALNGTYFTGNKFKINQNSSIYICMFHIYKSHPQVKQLLIYLDNFELAPPINGNCVIDRLVVTGQNTNSIVPEICGINTGQHFYVDVDSTFGPVSLTILSSGAQGLPVNFKIRIFQLKEGNQLLAPNNCLQYYTNIEGVVESFNYQFKHENSTSTQSSYVNNLNYAICIRKEIGYCSITYSNVDSSGKEYSFQLVNFDNVGVSTVPSGQAGQEIFNCPDDYIVTSGIRLCGNKVNDASIESDFSKNYPVTDRTNGPFILNFHTDGNITGRGFHLIYRQNLCLT